ncbi:MAG: type II toxin-antitoxin system Phd/YefM family antitoxin [Chloroflexales bacterium]
MSKPSTLGLDVDLQSGVVPISKAASSLAALIKRSKERQQPIIVTQKGYPTGVLLPIDLYTALRALVQGGTEGGVDLPALDEVVLPDVAEDAVEDAPTSESDAPAAPRNGRRTKPTT